MAATALLASSLHVAVASAQMYGDTGKPAPKTPPAPKMVSAKTVDEGEAARMQEYLRATENAFAKTMADRDRNAFAKFIADDAIFFGRDKVIRYKENILKAWAPYFQGDQAPFSWHPDTVEVLDDSSLGLSTGPVFDSNGKLVGTFNSIWRHRADGKWEIIFDKGCPSCPVTK